MSKLVYHSALSDAASDKEVQRTTDGKSVAIAHDVFKGFLPKEFDSCDIIYSEPAWKHGFDKFNKRAGVNDQRLYSEYLRVISSIINSLGKPCIIISGKHAQRGYVGFHRAIPVRLVIPAVPNGADAIAFCWNFYGDIEGMTTPDIIKMLSGQYDRIGDFCCGYGHTGKIFSESGKSFVLSDYNAKCIGYIDEHINEWRKV